MKLQIFQVRNMIVIDDVIQRKDEILDDYDLPILPAHNDGFNETFLEEDCWHDVRIKK